MHALASDGRSRCVIPPLRRRRVGSSSSSRFAASRAASRSARSIRSLDPLIGVVARDLQSDPHTIALLATALAIPYAFIQPILGPVGDALGKERIMKVCLAILAAT